MLIAAYGQEHDPETKAIPKEQMDVNEILTKFEAMKLSNEAFKTEFKLVRHLLSEDRGVRNALNLTDQRFESLRILYNLLESSYDLEISLESLKSWWNL